MEHGIGFLLLTTIGGYWVLERAETHKGELRRVGRLVGSLVIVVSIIGMGCKIWWLANGGLYCPVGWHGKGWHHPDISGMSMGAEPTQ